jgi:cytochrome P450
MVWLRDGKSAESHCTLELILETLRKYSTVGVLARCAKEAYVVSGTKHIIEKGQQLWIPVYAIHNDEGRVTFISR